MRRTRRLAALVASAFGCVALEGASAATGCAVGDKSDLATDLGATDPGVDAAYDPRPAQPLPASASDSEGEGEGSSASSGGAKTPAPDADGGSSSGSSGSPPPSPPKPTQGEVLVTEVLYDPSTPEPSTEWIEIHNAALSSRSLAGLTLVDGAGRTKVIGAGVEVPAGGYVVLVRSSSGALGAKVPSSAIVFEYGAGADASSGVLLTNAGTGKITLRDGATDIAQAPYGGWFSSMSGKSIQLKTLSYAASLTKASWCASANAWATGADKGTPGAPNDCP